MSNYFNKSGLFNVRNAYNYAFERVAETRPTLDVGAQKRMAVLAVDACMPRTSDNIIELKKISDEILDAEKQQTNQK